MLFLEPGPPGTSLVMGVLGPPDLMFFDFSLICSFKTEVDKSILMLETKIDHLRHSCKVQLLEGCSSALFISNPA